MGFEVWPAMVELIPLGHKAGERSKPGRFTAHGAKLFAAKGLQADKVFATVARLCKLTISTPPTKTPCAAVAVHRGALRCARVGYL
jgi:hypothetical protein